MAVKPIPSDYHTVTPYLFVEGAATLIEFLKQGFAAKEIRRTLHPEGSIMNAEVKIGDSVIMLSEARCEFKPMPSSIYLYVENTDTTYDNALKAGAISMMQPNDEFWGDRHAAVKDPNGNYWWIATHQEDVSSEEIEQRIKVLFGSKEEV
ncbi:glyoxalase [Nostoc sp. PCC 7120 = FACHB-418]|uniref:VOC family protein n=1 Tax=Nostoc sp. (strain PCC 7120 / SAG 25.82 / UTEX 2576) TaxID=103690 RepID=UPI000F8C6E41|nr:glyoxalase/bleomycin resistance/extradiol dioxygenase family protein [Nostoc sp. PCC 7120 = FACHB-418]RUR72048.1 glyoxalase [Nostoc sp. PCC 7120 = FACHB-418]